MSAIGEFISYVIGDVIFEMILEPLGAFVRLVLFRLRGKKVKFKELMPDEGNEEIVFNAITNRIVSVMFIGAITFGIVLLLTKI